MEMSSILQDIVNLEDVKGAILFRIDGSVIDSAYKEQYNQEVLYTLQWCKGNIEKISTEMQKSSLKKVIYELNYFSILFSIANEITILATIFTKQGNLSLISIEAQRKVNEIFKILWGVKNSDKNYHCCT